MNQSDFQKEINQLTELITAANGIVPTDMASPSITSNGFYQAIQTATELNCYETSYDSTTLLLIARIAFTSSTLTNIRFFCNNLGDNAPEIILTLSKVKSLQFLNLQSNKLAQNDNIMEIIEDLSNSQLKHLNVKYNGLSLTQKNEINEIITARENDVIVHDALITEPGIVPELIPDIVSLIALCVPDFPFECDF